MQCMAFCVWASFIWYVFKISCMLYFIFLQPDNIPSHGCTAFDLTPHPWMGIWVVPTFWLLAPENVASTCVAGVKYVPDFKDLYKKRI